VGAVRVGGAGDRAGDEVTETQSDYRNLKEARTVISKARDSVWESEGDSVAWHFLHRVERRLDQRAEQLIFDPPPETTEPVAIVPPTSALNLSAGLVIIISVIAALSIGLVFVQVFVAVTRGAMVVTPAVLVHWLTCAASGHAAGLAISIWWFERPRGQKKTSMTVAAILSAIGVNLSWWLR
jgi:hypothetical protein